MTTPGTRFALLRHRDFILLLGGSAASMFGDQFTLVALPLLVLTLSNDAAALGLVMAAIALPRAVFILVGGAVVDRLSPRRVLLVARAANALCVTLLAVRTLYGDISLGEVYALAVGIGVSTAFAYPAGAAILPQVVEREALASGNALALGARQASFLVGPALAALVIAQGNGKADAHSLGLAFALDAASFMVSLASLALIRITCDPPATNASPRVPVMVSITEGIRTLWQDVPLRAFTLYSTSVLLLISGPIQVGLPLLVTTQLDTGDGSLGMLMAANGAGMLLGGMLTGPLLRAARHRLGYVLIGMDALLGMASVVLGMTHATWQAALLLMATGMLGGFSQIGVMTWIQRRVAPHMIGRAMSVLMVTTMSVVPFSAVAAGAALRYVSLPVLLATAGAALVCAAVIGAGSRVLRRLGNDAPAQVIATP